MKNTTEIDIGSIVRCKGIGYPHWKDRNFKVEVIFPNNTIGLHNRIRVAISDFDLHKTSVEVKAYLDEHDDLYGLY